MAAVDHGPTQGMLEALDLALGGNSHEWDHLIEIMYAIHEKLSYPHRHMGSLVEFMADEEFERAFIHADGTNKRFFGVLMYYRVIVLKNGAW